MLECLLQTKGDERRKKMKVHMKNGILLFFFNFAKLRSTYAFVLFYFILFIFLRITTHKIECGTNRVNVKTFL